jgi:ribonuclease III
MVLFASSRDWRVLCHFAFASSIILLKSESSRVNRCLAPRLHRVLNRTGRFYHSCAIHPRQVATDSRQAQVVRETIDISNHSVSGLEQKLLHRFSNRRTLVRAMIHKSCSGHPIRIETETDGWLRADGIGNNERCEWLGDRVFGMYVSFFLYRLEPEKSEGELSKLSHALVSRAHANEMAIKLGLSEHLVTSPEYEFAGPDAVPVPSRFGDFLECCFAALFTDGGDPAVQDFFNLRVAPLLEETMKSASGIFRNYRSELQEMLLQHGFDSGGLGTQLEYRGISPAPESQSHGASAFFCQSIYLYDTEVAVGVGQTKSKAAQEASRILLERLQSEDVALFLRSRTSDSEE